ncbi:hypothetical protein ACQUY5_24290 [Bacillus cereus]|uniref:hypothetical protein n=1 Tax=Bacillus cereus TaxID=1396 RepID=UPI003D181ED6
MSIKENVGSKAEVIEDTKGMKFLDMVEGTWYCMKEGFRVFDWVLMCRYGEWVVYEYIDDNGKEDTNFRNAFKPKEVLDIYTKLFDKKDSDKPINEITVHDIEDLSFTVNEDLDCLGEVLHYPSLNEKFKKVAKQVTLSMDTDMFLKVVDMEGSKQYGFKLKGDHKNLYVTLARNYVDKEYDGKINVRLSGIEGYKEYVIAVDINCLKSEEKETGVCNVKYTDGMTLRDLAEIVYYVYENGTSAYVGSVKETEWKDKYVSTWNMEEDKEM